MKTCVISLDLINDICHPDGKLGHNAKRFEQHHIVENTNRVLNWARENKHLVCNVKVGFRPNYADASLTSPLFSKAKQYGALNLSASGTKFVDELSISDNDLTIIKHRVSAFYGTDLELILRANRIEKLILCGVATNNAVELTAREAHDRDFQVVIAADTTQTSSDEEQNASLNFLTKIATIKTSKEITNAP